MAHGCRCGKDWGERDRVSEFAQLLTELLDAALLCLRVGFDALLDLTDSIVEDLPDQSTEPVGDRPNGAFVTESRRQPPEDGLEVATLLLHRRLSRLGQDPAEESVPFRRPRTIVLFRAFLASRAGPHPRGKLGCRVAYLGDDLLG